MSTCCIRGCNSNSRKNNEGLSFFRFPKNGALKRLWINNIGSENIKPAGVIKICSKHFEDSCINRTLEVVRLKDDVAPTLFPFTSSSVQPRVALSMSTDNIMNTTVFSEHKPMQIGEENHIFSGQLQLTNMDVDLSHTDQLQTTLTKMDIDSSVNTGDSSMVLPVEKIQSLARRVQEKNKRIKMLTQKCRRLKHKVLTYQNIIDQLKKQNLVLHEGAILLEECAGSPEFLNRQILKHRNEPSPRSYGEDIRKFSLTLNFLSPKGLYMMAIQCLIIVDVMTFIIIICFYKSL